METGSRRAEHPPHRGLRAGPGGLLILLVLTWAVSWPVIKVGVSSVPPLWFACWRYVIAAACLFALVALRRMLIAPPRTDWPLVLVSGALQMAAYAALTGLALLVLPPGRAAILAFSTPIWVVPLAAWRLNEHVSRAAALGVGAGLLGVATIAAPSLAAGGADRVLAYGLLMGAAAAWAVSIVFVRGHRFTASPLALAPWQMLVAALLLVPFAVVIEGAPRAIGPSGLAALAYVGPVATAFAYWAVVEAGRHVPARTMSMALLAAPCLGILISALTLGEAVDASLLAGVVLIGLGIRLATGSRRRRKGAIPMEAPGKNIYCPQLENNRDGPVWGPGLICASQDQEETHDPGQPGNRYRCERNRDPSRLEGHRSRDPRRRSQPSAER